jgi:hypothetical protein
MNFFKLFFGKGCSHRFSWPRVDDNGRHYQICSDCGKAYEYDWNTMKRTEHVWASKSAPHLARGSQISR